MSTPSLEYRRTHFHRTRKIHTGLDARAHHLAHLWRRRAVADLRTEALDILDQAARLRELDTLELSNEFFQCRAWLRREAKENPNCIHKAFAAIVETARRHTGLLAHPEQVMGALALSRGFLAEMQTGEGKTLVIGLAATLAAGLAPACHVITANDYLAARDAEWLRPFYAACGLSVGCVTGEMQDAERAQNYAFDITYTTAKEVTADFLRDQLRQGQVTHPARRLVQSMLQPERSQTLVLRGLHRAIVDEADHALIDEAVTPLIISRQQENAPLLAACQVAHEVASTLRRGQDYEADERAYQIVFRPDTFGRIAKASPGVTGMWAAAGRRLELVNQALVAREFFHRDKQYLVHEGKVMIIDESTGRVMPQRTWRQGLHQAIEAKEGVEVTSPTETLARLSFQRFFRLYDRLAGITGTAREAAGECWHMYHLPFVRIPTHRPCIREQWPDRVFAEGAEKWRAVVEEVQQLHTLGRPLLIGTRTVAASMHLAKLLTHYGLPHELLNAAYHRQEAEIVEQAGQAARITIATNMAGRGTDIKLGPGVAVMGGLHVIATERHESGRVDRQLFGRAGRQGDPGSAQAFVSLDDALPKRFAPAWAVRTASALLRHGQPGGEVFALGVMRRAQAKAEHTARRQREVIQQTDTWLEEALSFT